MNYIAMTDDAAFEALCGNSLGNGGAREAFEVNGDPDVVIKKSILPRNTPNWFEWVIWMSIQDTPQAVKFGKCYSISGTGLYLIMERLEGITDDEKTKTPRLPGWVGGDVWPTQFGKNKDGIIKLRDYGSPNLGLSLADAEDDPMNWQLPKSPFFR